MPKIICAPNGASSDCSPDFHFRHRTAIVENMFCSPIVVCVRRQIFTKFAESAFASWCSPHRYTCLQVALNGRTVSSFSTTIFNKWPNILIFSLFLFHSAHLIVVVLMN